MTTWIIDDDPIQIFVATMNLQKIKFSQNIHSVNNAKNALEELKIFTSANDKNFPDLIFLDINMPQMDGWQFLEEFEKFSWEKKVAVYLLTSSIDPLDSKRAKTYKSIQGFLLKPVNQENLLKIREKYEDD